MCHNVFSLKETLMFKIKQRLFAIISALHMKKNPLRLYYAVFSLFFPIQFTTFPFNRFLSSILTLSLSSVRFHSTTMHQHDTETSVLMLPVFTPYSLITNLLPDISSRLFLAECEWNFFLIKMF